MKRTNAYLLIFTGLITLLGFPSVSPAATCDPSVGRAVSVEGRVETRRVGATKWQPVGINDTFCAGDRIRVRHRSRADVALENQPVLRLDQNTVITLGGMKDTQTFLIDLVQGATYFFSRTPRALEVVTAFVNAGIEGTEGLIKVEANSTSITIFEGKVLASNDAGSQALTRGQSLIAEAGKAPVLRVVVRPRDAVRWALYYPSILSVPPEGYSEEIAERIPEDLREPHVFAHRASLRLAASRSDQADPNVRRAYILVYRASTRLTVGRVDEANTDIKRALQLDPNNSNAFALQAIIAVTQNEKELGLKLAQRAVQSDPQSAPGRIALSYAQQAHFDLEGARNSLEKAVEVSPNDPLAWASLAEIRMSFGELDGALEAAQKAEGLNPNLARTQTVLGFAYLLQVNTKKARVAFEKAIRLDQATPLARLGLGLATIREGDLINGRRELEVAVSLDPDNSLNRSYLGKAFYEEKRNKLSSDQLKMAKELDPKDPTPYLYDAIRKQTTNRPVEALADLQKARELNDNRAVYRSRQLLDSDQASRSASLGRIFTDLGFQQRGLFEGWMAVNKDPSNYSSHRLLADLYSTRSRHEIARVSELFISQMLQPNNITPIQPRLAESNLFLISAGGPGSLSFNEFNALFNRNQMALLGSGIVGSHDTVGGEAVIAGIYDKLSFSAGVTGFDGDGWRPNADQKDYIANGFVQMELTQKTGIQAEYRHRTLETGDVTLNFNPTDFRSNVRQKTTTNSYRAGLRHNFTPNSIVLASVAYQIRDFTLTETAAALPFPAVTLVSLQDEGPDQEAISVEAQHLFRSRYFNTTAGGGYFKVNAENLINSTLSIPFLPPFPLLLSTPSSIDKDVSHGNVYVYSQIKPITAVTVILGASGDFYDTDEPLRGRIEQFNPKFGFIWNPAPTTVVRGAVLRVLKRTLITDATLEPTQVAGFNQFFDDAPGTESWRYGGAIDQKFTNFFYGGMEFSYRLLKLPFTDPLTSADQTLGRSEEFLGRGYLFFAPYTWLAVSAEYQYERTLNDTLAAFSAKEIDTHRVPVGVRLFHPSGLTASVKGTYFYQAGEFTPRGTVAFKDDHDHFMVVDATVGFRLPKRQGFITVGATNIFDQEFSFQEIDLRNPTVQPSRFAFLQITLALN